ncbi:MAG TPA: SRPBCC domain-containing protein [Gemmatimonadales bacterium]|nr:SRPBCC domain-containing protein [Gemmatimonadales bacterium]
MTATDDSAPVLVVRRQIAAQREKVFEAWLDSESLAHWMRPGDSTHATVSVDPRVGGGFRIVMEGPTHGAVEHRGEYLAIEPPSLLSFTWISRPTDYQPTVVTIEFHERGTGTELVLTHRGLAPKAVEGHRKGWTDIVRLLDEALTRG